MSKRVSDLLIQCTVKEEGWKGYACEPQGLVF